MRSSANFFTKNDPQAYQSGPPKQLATMLQAEGANLSKMRANRLSASATKAGDPADGSAKPLQPNSTNMTNVGNITKMIQQAQCANLGGT